MHMMTNGTCIVEQRARLPLWLMMLREVGSRQVVSCYQRKWWGSGWPRMAQPSCPSLYTPHITPGVRTASQRILLMLSQWRAAVCIFTWRILPDILHGTLRAGESPWRIAQPSAIQDCTTAQQKAAELLVLAFQLVLSLSVGPEDAKIAAPSNSSWGLSSVLHQHLLRHTGCKLAISLSFSCHRIWEPGSCYRYSLLHFYPRNIRRWEGVLYDELLPKLLVEISFPSSGLKILADNESGDLVSLINLDHYPSWVPVLQYFSSLLHTGSKAPRAGVGDTRVPRPCACSQAGCD